MTMTGWIYGVGIGERSQRCRCALAVAVLIFVATCVSLPTADAQDGFLSLDCGGGASYNDSNGLQWVNDDAFITTGNRSSEQSGYPRHLPALANFRYFPRERSKYCYELPALSYATLVRASFYMDESEFAARKPFKFVVSVDATDWFTVTSGDATSQSLLVVQEAIFFIEYTTSPALSFCLRSVSGMPFISSLEQRYVNSSIYDYPGVFTQYLSLGVRRNCGAENIADVRYPADPFDRIWTTPDASFAKNFTSIQITKPRPNSTIHENYVPLKVMQDAWVFGVNGSLHLNISPVITSGPQAYVYVNTYEYATVSMYFEDMNITSSTGIQIGMDNSVYHVEDWIPSRNPPVYNQYYTTLGWNGVNVDLQSKVINPRASISAIEIYGQLPYNLSETYTFEVDLIGALSEGFSLTDWQGDPCLPVPHDWLSCEMMEWGQIYQTTYIVTSM